MSNAKNHLEDNMYAAEAMGAENMKVLTKDIRSIICELDSYYSLMARLERFPVVESLLETLEEIKNEVDEIK